MPFTRATWVWFKSQKVLQLIIIGVKSPSNPGVSLFSWPVPPGSCSNAHLWAAAAGLLRRRSAGVCCRRFLFLILFGDFGRMTFLGGLYDPRRFVEFEEDLLSLLGGICTIPRILTLVWIKTYHDEASFISYLGVKGLWRAGTYRPCHAVGGWQTTFISRISHSPGLC